MPLADGCVIRFVAAFILDKYEMHNKMPELTY